MGKFTTVATYSRFESMWNNNTIDNYSLYFIQDTGQLYAHGVLLNSVAYGTEASGAVSITIAGVTKSLALSSHTHSNYIQNNQNIDLQTYKLVSGQNDLIYLSGGNIYVGNTSTPITIQSSTDLKSYRDSHEYTILDTGNFSITNRLSTGVSYNNAALFKYGSLTFQIDYVKRTNAIATFNELSYYTQAGTNQVNNKQYGFMTFYTDGAANPVWAQLRINITDSTVEYRTSTQSNNWISLSSPQIVQNALDQAGIVAAPSSQTINMVWKTDAQGNPAWREDTAAENTWRNIRLNDNTTDTLGTDISTGALYLKQGVGIQIRETNGKIEFINTSINVWKAANTTQEGYVPQLSATIDPISAQGTTYVLSFIDGTETTPVWRKLPANAFLNTWTAWEPATDSTDGTAGIYPAPTSANYQKFLRGDGSWQSVPLADGTGATGNWEINITGHARYLETWQQGGATTYGNSYTLKAIWTNGNTLKLDAGSQYIVRVDSAVSADSLSNFTSGASNIGEHDCNNILTNGHWYYRSNGPSATIGGPAGGALYSQAYSVQYVTQIAQDYNNGHLFLRGRHNGTWSEWLINLDSGNWKNIITGDPITYIRGKNFYGSWNETWTPANLYDTQLGLADSNIPIIFGAFTKSGNQFYHSLFFGGFGRNGFTEIRSKYQGYTSPLEYRTAYDNSSWGQFYTLMNREDLTNLPSSIGYNKYVIKPKADIFAPVSSVTGALCISLPENMNNPLCSFWIDVYNHVKGTSFSVYVAGQPYTTQWFQPSAVVLGANHKVRFGRSSTNRLIYIGELDTTWSFPSVSIRNVIASYDPNMDAFFGNGWSISFVQSFETIDHTFGSLDFLGNTMSKAITGSKTSSLGRAAGWRRIAETTGTYGTTGSYGIFSLCDFGNGYNCHRTFEVSVTFTSVNITQISGSSYANTPRITKARVVYVNSWSSTAKSYLEIYITADQLYDLQCDYTGRGWNLISPITVDEAPTDNRIACTLDLVDNAVIAPNFITQGNVYATNFYTTSDRSKKTDISILSQHIRKFQLKETGKYAYGVVAQEVPEMFREGKEGEMTVNYNSVLSYYIGCLENKVNQLEEEVAHLKEKNYG